MLVGGSNTRTLLITTLLNPKAHQKTIGSTSVCLSTVVENNWSRACTFLPEYLKLFQVDYSLGSQIFRACKILVSRILVSHLNEEQSCTGGRVATDVDASEDNGSNKQNCQDDPYNCSCMDLRPHFLLRKVIFQITQRSFNSRGRYTEINVVLLKGGRAVSLRGGVQRTAPFQSRSIWLHLAPPAWNGEQLLTCLHPRLCPLQLCHRR